MIHIYTNRKYLSRKKGGILDTDMYFNEHVTDVDMLGAIDRKYLKEIDESEPISGTQLNGRFGEFSLPQLASGVKTLLLLSLIHQGKLPKPAFIDVTCCGQNVRHYAFKYLDILEIPCILQHRNFYTQQNFDYKLNGKTVVHTTDELFELSKGL